MHLFILVIFILAQIIINFFLITSLIGFNDSIDFFGIPIHIIFAIILNICSLILLAIIYKNEEKRVVQSTEATHEEQFRALVTSVRSDRHDFNNHLTVIAGLIKIGNYKSAAAYIDEIVGEVKINNFALKINNPIFASILFSKMELYQKQKVTFVTNIETEAITNKISSTDLIRLISNLLDNAYEATIQLPQELQKIVFEITEEKEGFLIRVKNSSVHSNFDSKLLQLGHTTKASKEKESRGYGLAIIQEVVKKYNGTLSINSEESLVVFSILIPKGAR